MFPPLLLSKMERVLPDIHIVRIYNITFFAQKQVVIRRFRVRLPGRIRCPVGPMVRRLTTVMFVRFIFMSTRSFFVADSLPHTLVHFTLNA